MKKKILTVAVLVICLSIAAAGTLAYFNTEATAHNVITSGGVEIELLEWADKDKTEPFPEEGITGVMPGTSVDKIVEVKNTGASEAWVRVKVEQDITLAEGVDGDPDPDLMVIEFNATDWELTADGYYCYTKALKPGETTEPLFASVKFDGRMDNMYQNCTATVDVTAQAVQTANNGAAVTEAQGWPAEPQN